MRADDGDVKSWFVALAAGATVAVAIAGCGGSSAERGAAETTSVPATTPHAPDTTDVGPTTEWPVVPAPALADNLVGDPAELRVAVWLPSSYAETDARYPVVYFLAGFGESASDASIGAALEPAIASGAIPAVIVVGASGRNALGGSFYVDSPVTGGWGTAIHRDLVSWIDATYRTIAAPEGRVVAGFSMGGFGAFDLAMRHPDVFGAVYALSPGAITPGLRA